MDAVTLALAKKYADEHGGASSWDELGKTVAEVGGDTLTWDGDMTGKDAIDMSILGLPAGVAYAVKLSDAVLTVNDLTGATITVVDVSSGDAFSVEQEESTINTTSFAGAIASTNTFVLSIYSIDDFCAAFGLPSGVYTNGTYFVIMVGAQYVSGLTIPNYTGFVTTQETITPLPVKYLHPSVPWVEEGEVVEILAETTPEVGDDDSDGVNDSFMITETMDLVAGNTYTVTWNGVEYVLVCQDLSELSGGQTSGLILGNTAQLGGTDTGDPFIIMYSPDAMAGSGFTGLCAYTDGSATVTYSIKMGSSTVNKLDNRCLDLAWLPVYKQKQVTLYDGTVSLSSNGWRTYDEPLFDPDLIIDKEEYTVTWAGDEYKCVGHNVKIDVDGATATLVFIGNASLGNYTENYGGYTEDTGEPFLYEYFGGEGSAFITFYGNGKDVDIAVTIKGPKLMPNKLPNAFLPDDATVFYLTSPNGTKYAITVADDGTLSAAEVTS